MYQILPTRIGDLVKAITPGVFLSSMLFLFLSIFDFLLHYLGVTSQVVYLVLMTITGAGFYGVVFLVMPIASTRSEAERWRRKVNGSVKLAYRALTR